MACSESGMNCRKKRRVGGVLKVGLDLILDFATSA